MNSPERAEYNTIFPFQPLSCASIAAACLEQMCVCACARPAATLKQRALSLASSAVNLREMLRPRQAAADIEIVDPGVRAP
jgi:hypothetical protein